MGARRNFCRGGGSKPKKDPRPAIGKEVAIKSPHMVEKPILSINIMLQ